MGLYEQILNNKIKIAVIGLGYVGLPIAIAFSKRVRVIGFDIDKDKIKLYQSGIDPTDEIGDVEIQNSTIEFTSNENRLKDAKFQIIAVPTPIKLDKTPDLEPVETASRIVGRNLSKGTIVVYESTVYPGVTEDVCIPILEEESSLKCGIDFKVGYSPERINPGDKVNTVETITKIVAGIDQESLEEISKIYEIAIKGGVFKVSSIKVAEAAKVAENSQRDINIAFMNELAMVFDRMGIDTLEVVKAMNTKWNALNFYPGLVGGHCIGVDPYYFLYEAEKLGYHSQIILAGRKINDGMDRFVVNAIIKNLILANQNVKSSKVLIMGLTFKENTSDVRNSKVIEIIRGLREYGIEPIIVDPLVNKEQARFEYDIELVNISEVGNVDCVVFAVAHDEFKSMTFAEVNSLFKPKHNNEKVVVDVKGIFDKIEMETKGFRYWRL